MDQLKQILDIAKKIEDNEIDIIMGARQINEFRDYLINDNPEVLLYPDLSIFFTIEFETRGLPISNDERKGWDSEALKIKDKEIERLKEKYREQTMKACEIIVKKLNNL